MTLSPMYGWNPDEDLVQAPRRPQLPPPATTRTYDPQLADLLTAHAAAIEEYTAAVSAVRAAEGPKGEMWRSVREYDRQQVRAGRLVDPGSAEIVKLIRQAPLRIAAAVIASAKADHLLDQILERARDAKLRAALAVAGIDWANAAAEKLRTAVAHRSRGEVEMLREDRALTWSSLQSLTGWVHEPTANYRHQVFGWPIQVQEVLADERVRTVLDELVGAADKDLGSRNLNLPEGIITSRPDEGHASRYRNHAEGVRLSRRERRQQARQ